MTVAPGPSYLGLLRLAPRALRADPLELVADLHREHGDVVRIPYHPAIGEPAYLVRHPDDVERVLRTEQDAFRKPRVAAGGDFTEVFGSGLVSSSGELWERQNRLIAPFFSRRRVAGLVERLLAEIESVVDGWAERAAEADTIRLLPATKHATLRVVGQALFSTDFGDRADAVIADLATLRTGFARRSGSPVSLPLSVPTPRNRELVAARDRIRGLAEALRDERRAAREVGEDFLALLLTAGDGEGSVMSDDQIRDEIVTFLIAGFETTAAALTWAFHCLAANPEVQQDVHKQLAERGPIEAGPGVRDAVAPARRVVDETIRLYPSVPMIGRETTEPTTLSGYDLPAGAVLVLTSYVTHRDERFFDAPETFDPSRFAGDPGRHEFAYYPFSAGRHSCTGRELATMVGSLLVGVAVRELRFGYAGEPPSPGPDMAVNLQPDRPLAPTVTRRGQPSR